MRKKSVEAPTPDEPPSRDEIREHLAEVFYTRFHMSLILLASCLAAMVVSWALLRLGMDRMWIRYPLAVLGAYVTFLLGVWLWLKYMASLARKSEESSVLDCLDELDVEDAVDGLSSLGEARSLVGVRAESVQTPAGAWTQSVRSTPRSGTSSRSGSGFNFDFDGDAEGIVLLILAGIVILAILFASGYIVWFAPEILAEAVFGAALAGGLAKRAKQEDQGGWVHGVVRKTWWPFAIVLVLSLVFAAYASHVYPGARTAREALERATTSPQAPAADAIR